MDQVTNAAGGNKNGLAQYNSFCIRDSKNDIFGKRIKFILGTKIEKER